MITSKMEISTAKSKLRRALTKTAVMIENERNGKRWGELFKHYSLFQLGFDGSVSSPISSVGHEPLGPCLVLERTATAMERTKAEMEAKPRGAMMDQDSRGLLNISLRTQLSQKSWTSLEGKMGEERMQTLRRNDQKSQSLASNLHDNNRVESDYVSRYYTWIVRSSLSIESDWEDPVHLDLIKSRRGCEDHNNTNPSFGEEMISFSHIQKIEKKLR